MSERTLEIQLFGGFFCRWCDGERVEIRGAKHRALLAILATAANGTHSRSWLQETLWALSGEEHGRASLRRALSDIRKVFGDSFSDIFETTNLDVRLHLERIELIGDASDGLFLDGLTLPEPGFQTWLDDKRRHLRRHASSDVLDLREGIAPRLAVLPFLSRNRTADEDHLADLLAMEVTRSLSRSRLIDVISHLSSRRLNVRTLDMSEVRETLGFDYVVYGTVRLEGDKFRVDADLADSATGRVVWAENFHGGMADLLSGQTSVVGALASRVGHGILKASVELAHARPVVDIADHALLMSSITLMHGHRPQEFLRAKEQFEELIRRSPQYSMLHAWYAKWHVLSAHHELGYSQNMHDAAKSATARALAADPSCAFSLAVDGMVHSHDKSAENYVSERFEQALEIDPSNALAWLLYSRLHMFNGNGEKALAYADRACALSPYDPHQYFYDMLRACARSVCGDYAGALELANRSLEANPRHTSTMRSRTIALSMLGRDEEARASADELLKWEPNLTIKSYLENHPAGSDRDLTRLWAETLRRSGVPES